MNGDYPVKAREEPGFVRQATVDDIVAIRVLYRDNRRVLGYFPAGATEAAVAQGRVLVYSRGVEILGYLLWGGTEQHSKIFQLVVESGSRRRLHGVRALLGAFLLSRPRVSRLVSLRCRLDNPATLFWASVGFVPVQFELSHGTGMRPIVRWVLPLHGLGTGRQLQAVDAWMRALAAGGSRQVMQAIASAWGCYPQVKYPLPKLLSASGGELNNCLPVQPGVQALGCGAGGDGGQDVKDDSSSASPHSTSTSHGLRSTGRNDERDRAATWTLTFFDL